MTNDNYYFTNTNLFSFIDSDFYRLNDNVFKNISGEKKPGTRDQF